MERSEEGAMNIVRIWHGVTLAAKAEQYLEFLHKCIVVPCQTAEGNEGLFVLKEPQGEITHFLLLSFWACEEALKKFAGADYCDFVHLSPEEKNLLIAFDSIARHYQIVYTSNQPIENKQ